MKISNNQSSFFPEDNHPKLGKDKQAKEFRLEKIRALSSSGSYPPTPSEVGPFDWINQHLRLIVGYFTESAVEAIKYNTIPIPADDKEVLKKFVMMLNLFVNRPLA